MDNEARIYKYSMASPRYGFVLPHGARVLSVGFQDTIVLWITVRPFETLTDNRVFLAFNTGDALPEGNLQFHGTATSEKGIVWHVFEDLDAMEPVDG